MLIKHNALTKNVFWFEFFSWIFNNFFNVRFIRQWNENCPTGLLCLSNYKAIVPGSFARYNHTMYGTLPTILYLWRGKRIVILQICFSRRCCSESTDDASLWLVYFRSTIDEMWEMAVAIIAVVLQNQSVSNLQFVKLIKNGKILGTRLRIHVFWIFNVWSSTSLVGFNGHFSYWTKWGSISNVSTIMLHKSEQIIQNCTHLLSSTTLTHTVNISLNPMNVFLFTVGPHSIIWRHMKPSNK